MMNSILIQVDFDNTLTKGNVSELIHEQFGPFNWPAIYENYKNKLISVEESNIYNPDDEINELTWYFSSKTKKDFAVEKFSMRMYFPSKMNQLLIDNGFEILHQWGDYYRTELGEGSKLQIYDVQVSL